MGQKCCSIYFVRLTTFRQDSDSNRDLWDRKYPPQPTVCHTWVTCFCTVGTIYLWFGCTGLHYEMTDIFPPAWYEVILLLIILSLSDTTLLVEYQYKASLTDIPFNESSEMRRCYISLHCNLFSKMTWRIKMHLGEVTLASMYTNIS